jgi:hypothetical protein
MRGESVFPQAHDGGISGVWFQGWGQRAVSDFFLLFPCGRAGGCYFFLLFSCGGHGALGASGRTSGSGRPGARSADKFIPYNFNLFSN